MKTKRYKCTVCNHIHEGAEMVATCPLCKAPASKFVEIKKSKGIDTNNNLYTIIYAVVLVAVVALMLAFVAGSLKSKQTGNVALDKKKQILSAINIDTKGGDANKIYDEYITESELIDINGKVLSTDREATFAVDVTKENSKAAAERQLPIYIATIKGEKKYIFPVRGAGLWGAIWGYIALNEDKNSVYGVYYSHASETPGLGAEITTPKFREQFIGKRILNAANEFVSIAIMKAGQLAQGKDQVEALAGGTITSVGVEDMLFNSLGQYKNYFKQTVVAETETINQEEVAL